MSRAETFQMRLELQASVEACPGTRALAQNIINAVAAWYAKELVSGPALAMIALEDVRRSAHAFAEHVGAHEEGECDAPFAVPVAEVRPARGVVEPRDGFEGAVVDELSGVVDDEAGDVWPT